MSGQQISTDKGGRKALDAALNLVPFIDLLSCCLAFLLMTAVWTTVSRMAVAQGSGPAGEGAAATVRLTLFIQQDGFYFERSTGDATTIPRSGANHDYDFPRLAEVLRAAKTAFPDSNELTVKSDDSVLYDKVVETMDIAISAKFPQITFDDKIGS